MKPTANAYAAAGVNIAHAENLLDEMKPALKAATRPEAVGSIGGFGGMFDISQFSEKYVHPVLVSSTDSVGTKVKVATLARDFRQIGADIVNHCCNDIAVCGAEPLFFLDYYATGELEAINYKTVLLGLAKACQAAGVALVGGETAELPGVYAENEFDLVGTIVGVVDKAKILTGAQVRPGDKLIGLASSGLHTNGFSLARKVFFGDLNLHPGDLLPGSTQTVAEGLLPAHVNYTAALRAMREELNPCPDASLREGNSLFDAAHITGGGFPGTVPRALPAACGARIQTSSWDRPAVFDALATRGGIAFDELYRVFNMGIGLVLVVAPEGAERAILLADAYGHRAWSIGEVTAEPGVVLDP